VRTVREILRHALGGCPRRTVCSFQYAKSKTCIYGPYQYCGKYRLNRRTVEKVKTKKSAIAEKL
jgi:hypothetical protein